MNYEELVEEIREIFMQADVSMVKEHIAYQFNILGDAEGAFYAEVADGKLAVEPYEYFDRDVLFTTSAETLLKIAKGQMDATAAFAVGKLKVEGDFGKALLLQDFAKGIKKAEKKAEKKTASKPEEKEEGSAVKEAAVKAEITDEKPEISEKPEMPEKPEMLEKPEMPEMPVKPEKDTKAEKTAKAKKTSKAKKASKKESAGAAAVPEKSAE